MAADISYLSQRSLAVYEATVIEQFSKAHQRNLKRQAIEFALWSLAFIVLASLTLIMPVVTQGFLQLLLQR